MKAVRLGGIVRQERVKDINFYCSAYRLSITALQVCLFMILFLSAWLGYKLATREKVRFYATSSAGGFAALQPFAEPGDAKVETVSGNSGYRRGVGY